MNYVPGSTSDVHLPASNTAAIVTYAAVSDRCHVTSGIAWSYDGAPTAGSLKIEDGSGSVIFKIDITAAGPGVIYFTPAKQGTKNTALITTLAAGGSGVTGKVSILGHSQEG